jgi:hypothetical protein
MSMLALFWEHLVAVAFADNKCFSGLKGVFFPLFLFSHETIALQYRNKSAKALWKWRMRFK